MVCSIFRAVARRPFVISLCMSTSLSATSRSSSLPPPGSAKDKDHNACPSGDEASTSNRFTSEGRVRENPWPSAMCSAAVSIRLPSARTSVLASGEALTQRWSLRFESRAQRMPGISTALQPSYSTWSGMGSEGAQATPAASSRRSAHRKRAMLLGSPRADPDICRNCPPILSPDLVPRGEGLQLGRVRQVARPSDHGPEGPAPRLEIAIDQALHTHRSTGIECRFHVKAAHLFVADQEAPGFKGSDLLFRRRRQAEVHLDAVARREVLGL